MFQPANEVVISASVIFGKIPFIVTVGAIRVSSRETLLELSQHPRPRNLRMIGSADLEFELAIRSPYLDNEELNTVSPEAYCRPEA
jgi:hypothetical protein